MTDRSLEQRLQTLYAVSVPTELDQRIAIAMTTDRTRRSGRTRPRLVAALAVAALLATVAAVPAVVWFEGWNHPFDHLWQISTPVDQTVTADGYRVTAHRAYADRLGVRVAMSVEDLDHRWSEFYVMDAHAIDAEGRLYEAWNGSGSRTPVDGSTAMWARFLIPDDVSGDDLKLSVTVTTLAVRTPEPIDGLDPNLIWATVNGAWTFEVEVPITLGEALAPDAEPVSASGITIGLDELGVVPSGTIARLAVDGLPELTGESVSSWFPVTSVEHDGQRLFDDPLEPGIVGSDGIVTLELSPVFEDLAGHWKITVFQFHSFDPISEQFGDSRGPWILEFDVAETP